MVLGNIVQPSPLTENPAVISFGAEGYVWPSNQLYLVNNTLVDDLSSGDSWLRANTAVLGKALDLGSTNGQDLRPQREYIHNAQTRALDIAPHNPGAMQQLKAPVP